jgi:hypothetical protein
VAGCSVRRNWITCARSSGSTSCVRICHTCNLECLSLSSYLYKRPCDDLGSIMEAFGGGRSVS